MTDPVLPAPSSNRTISRFLLLLALLGVIAVGGGAVWVWSATSGSDAGAISVVNSGGDSAGYILNLVPRNTPAYIETYTLCSTSGSVAITSVEPVGATDPVKIEWGVHHGQYTGVAGGNGPLSSMPGFIHRPVYETCAQGANGTYAYLGISMTANGPVGVQAFKVNYSGGSATVPFSFETCPGKHCPQLLKNEH
jgi:hypothetical protein